MAGGSRGEMEFEDRSAKPGRWFRFWTGWRAEPDARPAAGLDRWKPDPERIGICCSGGGIRSAAYSLGALQHLQQKEVLQKATYLAAVSGGSYIATALTIARRSATDPFAHGTPEERYLRNRTNYLVPHGNEAVFLGYRMALGIAINVVLVGLTLGLAAIAGALLYEWAGIAAAGELHVRRWALAGTAGVAGASLALGLFYLLVRLSRWGGRGRSRANADGSPSGPELTRLVLQTWVVRLFWGAVGLGAILVVVPALADWLRDPRGTVGDVAAPAIPAASLLTVVVALLTQLLSKPPKELIDQAGKVGRAAALRPKLIRALAGVAATVAVPLLALAWVVAVVAWTVGADAEAVAVALAAGATVLTFLLVRGDLTSWSLHPFYRARLASVFAVRRDGDRARALDTYREIPAMHKLSEQETPGPWPTLVVCAAANVSDPGATPFGRRVTSFTFSSEAVGGPLVGYMGAEAYETVPVAGSSDLDKRVRSDAMTAVAVSGAAISPSMGKHTYRAGRALLALANIRLGVWMPNPRTRRRDDEAGRFERTPPRPRPYRLFLEMSGRNSMRDRYLYVTDGGHYENLGLVELLRRGCTRVYCFDGSGGKGVGEELGDAIAIARSELGVEIKVDTKDLRPNKKRVSAADHVVATIRYPPGPDGAPGPTGKLVYCRQLLTEKAPEDVKAHARRNPKFPHDPTSDQFLTDQSFESYRALGRLAAKNALAESLAP